MGTSQRFSSVPMTDLKGKGILYEEDDDPIQLEEEEDSQFGSSICHRLPIVHDEYSWIIPFWVEIIGIPLHLWTVKNLKNIGKKLGHVDTIELSAGRLLVEADTRKSLVFNKKVQSPRGDEVTIQFKYEKLFKHCSYCGFLSHEATHCPKKMEEQRLQAKEAGVFSRVHLPFEPNTRQSLLADRTERDRYHYDKCHTS
ncbi:hypothetical protein IGI04_007345 [Brassica rapa subsp. trilocularis]|uniref:Zinc knuckle CX2CX4HX4C domain-containing protein n=1 Tax=Brassica rapa subsp. trilocularis TaxID=1813537 RepID=A0ABQ7NKQ7_BRACM|nr:hypothetical protein IGI04_007345 [Brassica rapa subsp. trilocularis]